jgi:hypothetical protein
VISFGSASQAASTSPVSWRSSSSTSRARRWPLRPGRECSCRIVGIPSRYRPYSFSRSPCFWPAP